MKMPFFACVPACFVLAALPVQASAQAPASLALLNQLPLLSATSGRGDFRVAPPYARASELTPQQGVPQGRIYHFTMHSIHSKYYPGISKTAPGQVVPYQRRVTVYVPAQYQPGTRLPFMVCQDSMGANILPTILNNLIAAKKVPVLAAIFIDNGGSDAQGSERGLEYDTVSGRYADFVEHEVLPRAEKTAGIKLTHNPSGRLTMGGSSGAAAAFTMAWFRPGLYHRVISWSGTYVNQQWPYNPASPQGAWDYHSRFIQQARRKPIRIWMEVGQHDLRYNDPESTFHNWVLANQRMYNVLKAKRYACQFVYAQDAHHVDGRVVEQLLPQALIWAWKGYPHTGVH